MSDLGATTGYTAADPFVPSGVSWVTP
jgi:hypothetical protein